MSGYERITARLQDVIFYRREFLFTVWLALKLATPTRRKAPFPTQLCGRFLPGKQVGLGSISQQVTQSRQASIKTMRDRDIQRPYARKRRVRPLPGSRCSIQHAPRAGSFQTARKGTFTNTNSG